MLAILSVFVYHTTRFFNSEAWHVKNPVTYFAADIVETTLANWIMALIFTISGASLFHALGKGGPGRFIRDKVLRLLVPLVAMGMIVFGVWQMYLERLSHGEFSGSFFEFVPEYFRFENIAWGGVHLWYLAMLFIFCLVFLPLFLWLRRGFGQRVMVRLGDWLASKGALYLLALPTVLALALTRGNGFWGDTGWGGGSILSHATFFLSGFLIISHAGLQENIVRSRWASLGLVAVLLVTLFSLMVIVGEPAPGTLLSAVGRSLWGLWAWSWTLAILGFGLKHLVNGTPFLTYASEAVLPFYILHQPALLSVGFFVVLWNIPAVLKFLVIDLAAFVLIMAVYEFVVRRVNVLRVLFGMKPQAAVAGLRPESRPTEAT